MFETGRSNALELIVENVHGTFKNERNTVLKSPQKIKKMPHWEILSSLEIFFVILRIILYFLGAFLFIRVEKPWASFRFCIISGGDFFWAILILSFIRIIKFIKKQA
jgi:hypothetical protein